MKQDLKSGDLPFLQDTRPQTEFVDTLRPQGGSIIVNKVSLCFTGSLMDVYPFKKAKLLSLAQVIKLKVTSQKQKSKGTIAETVTPADLAFSVKLHTVGYGIHLSKKQGGDFPEGN